MENKKPCTCPTCKSKKDCMYFLDGSCNFHV